MKTKMNILALFSLILVVAGCKSEPEYHDSVFMTGTLSSSTVKFLVEGESTMGLTVTSTDLMDTDVKINVKVTPDLLESFNASTGRNSQMPPEGSYRVECDDVVIVAGQVKSTPIKVTAYSDKLQEGVPYCIPITIVGLQGGEAQILGNARTAYVMLNKVIETKAAYLSGSQCFDIPTFAGENSPVKELSQMTLEIKICPTKFSGISSVMGCEENFLLRFSNGAGIPANQLQLAKGSIGASSNPDKKDHYEMLCDQLFETNQWAHVAVVYDGQLLRFYLNGKVVQSLQVKNGGYVNLSTAYNGVDHSDFFSIGRSVGYDRFFKGYVSECRVWNVARTKAEIQDAVCAVDATTPGLVAYWRFNGETQEDGTVLDMTGHGHNAQPHGTVTYVDNQKCPF